MIWAATREGDAYVLAAGLGSFAWLRDTARYIGMPCHTPTLHLPDNEGYGGLLTTVEDRHLYRVIDRNRLIAFAELLYLPDQEAPSTTT